MCKKLADLEAKLKHAEENCINKTCVVFKDKEDCVAKLLELEKENERLTVSYETLKLHDEEEIGMLKSENAELKTDYEVLSCSVGDFDELQNKLEEEQRKNNGLSDNLTKAKFLLKQLVDAFPKSYSDVVKDTLDEAKKFVEE